jgi:putative selenium metabolism protein SsnA
MSDTYLLTNVVVLTGGDPPAVLPDGGVAWRGDRIVAVGPEDELRSALPEHRQVDGRGGLAMPALVNLHHHFYSALARGLDPGRTMRDFGEVLEGLWWRLDRALDPDTVRLSALLTLADCIRWGCTTVFDHHASPSCLRGSLDVIADAVDTAGLSAVLCYEVSDRNGHHEALAGVDENLDFFDRHRDHPRIRGTLGLHASFTVRDSTLDEAARRRPEGCGCHVHVAEDALDVNTSRVVFGSHPIDRLLTAGLLDEQSLLAHCVHLDDEALDAVARCGAVIVHNPESNANNAVGRLNLGRTFEHDCTVGLGTDGMSSAMLRALRAAFLGHRSASGDPGSGFAEMATLNATNAAVARRYFPEPLLGEITAGAPADIAVVDAPPPTDVDEGNALGHLLYGASEAPVRHTVARGRVLMEDFALTTLDPQALAVEARELSPALWQRFHALDGGALDV